MMRVMWPRRLILGFAAVLYAASLFMPAGVWFQDPDRGFEYLLFGWMGLFAGVFCWLANPCALITILLIAAKKYKLAVGFSVIAVLFAGSTLIYSAARFHIAFDAGGTFGTPAIGFYLWLTSLILLSIGTFLYNWKSNP